MATCWTYAISNVSHAYVYVGLCENVAERVGRHQNGREGTTKPHRPFVLLFSEEHIDGRTARAREKFLKSGQGKEFLKQLRGTR